MCVTELRQVCVSHSRQATPTGFCEPNFPSTTTELRTRSSASDISSDNPADVAHLGVLWVQERACSASVGAKTQTAAGEGAQFLFYPPPRIEPIFFLTPPCVT